MTTKIPKKKLVRSGGCTEFQLHKSQQTIFNNILKNICDYSEFKLIRCINDVNDQQQKLILIALLNDYITGHVAVAWKKGKPIWIKIIKG